MQRLRLSDRVPPDIEAWQAMWPESPDLPGLAGLDTPDDVDGAASPSACALPAPAGGLAALAWFRTETAGMPA